jgi:molybdopterin synthase catalytic subunit
MVHVSVQSEDFDVGQELAYLRQIGLEVGAVASFVGTVRQWWPTDAETGMPSAPSASPVQAQFLLEHYPGMTERVLEQAAKAALTCFGTLGIRLIHRVGSLTAGDQIVLVAVAATHRRAAFDCCDYLMDWLKTQAPFWKKEVLHGEGHWVDARDSDAAALQRWETPESVCTPTSKKGS